MASKITLKQLFLESTKEKDEGPEKPLKLSWSWHDLMTICSVPRELAVKYATTLKKLGFKPGKSKHDHCWIKPSSERFRFTEKFMKQLAARLEQAGASVEVEYQGEEILEGRNLKSVFGFDS